MLQIGKLKRKKIDDAERYCKKKTQSPSVFEQKSGSVNDEYVSSSLNTNTNTTLLVNLSLTCTVPISICKYTTNNILLGC